MTLQKWINDRAVHGYPTLTLEDVREAGLYTSEQIMKNELNRLCSNKTLVNVYRGFYVIIPVHYVLRGSVPATYRDKLPEDALIKKNTETGTIRISNSLLTAADLVQNQQHVGGLSRVATILEELTEQIDIDSQFPVLISYVKTVTWQRLGYILENIIEDKATADKLYEQLRSSSVRMVYKPLSTSAEDNPSSRDSRWKININVEIETGDI